MNYKKLKGITTAVITPFDEKGKVNFDILRKHINYLIKNGVDALYPLGTTGEFPLLSIEERKKIAEVVVEENKGRLPIVIQVGDDNISVVENLIKHAKSIGADGVAVVTPYYYNFLDDEVFNLYDYLAKKFSDFPIYLYNIPQITSVPISKTVVKKLLLKHKNIWGIKDSSGDFSKFLDFIKLREEFLDFLVLNGTDKYILSAYQLKADGIVSGFSNCFPKLFHEFSQYFIVNDEKKYMESYRKILQICDILQNGAILDFIKGVCIIKGKNVGKVRFPLKSLSLEEERKLEKDLNCISI